MNTDELIKRLEKYLEHGTHGVTSTRNFLKGEPPDKLIMDAADAIKSQQQQLGNAMDLLVTAGGEARLMNQDIESLQAKIVEQDKSFTETFDLMQAHLMDSQHYQARAKELESLVNKIYNGDCSLTTASIIAANFIPTEQPE